ncbi:MAG: recombination mediator RecR [Spirochaetia bacterium]|nr:recombination mediator RecR [Spirochaetia bacterium]
MAFDALEDLVHLLTSLPGIGQRSAYRIAFHLIRQDSYQVQSLSDALIQLKEKIRFCNNCGGLCETELCSICSDDSRNTELLCIVEEPQDIFAIEKTGEFDGMYHVLMGAISPLDGIGPDDLRIRELRETLENRGIKEIFIATNPTLEGDATASYISEIFSEKGILFSRISHGLQTGGSIEFADRSTLARSIRNRQKL